MREMAATPDLRASIAYRLPEECPELVTRAEARREIERHEQTWSSWLLDHGDREEYPAAVVLAWLGY